MSATFDSDYPKTINPYFTFEYRDSKAPEHTGLKVTRLFVHFERPDEEPAIDPYGIYHHRSEGFPNLCWAYLESLSNWVPYALPKGYEYKPMKPSAVDGPKFSLGEISLGIDNDLEIRTKLQKIIQMHHGFFTEKYPCSNATEYDERIRQALLTRGSVESAAEVLSRDADLYASCATRFFPKPSEEAPQNRTATTVLTTIIEVEEAPDEEPASGAAEGVSGGAGSDRFF